MKIVIWVFIASLLFSAESFSAENFLLDGLSSDSEVEKKLPVFHHRSDILMPESFLVPESLLFEVNQAGQSKITCKTCHGIEDIEEQDFKTIDKQQKDFFRSGPYEELTELCYLCHKKEENQRENIHILLDEDQKYIEHNCLYCHFEVLKPEDFKVDLLLSEPIKNKDFKLRLPIETTCYGCHLKTPHLNILEHQGEMEEEMLLYMKKKSQLNDIYMPLGKNNRIICVSCHQSHQQGVLEQGVKQVAKKVTALEVEQRIENKSQVSSDLKQGVSYVSHPWSETYALDKYDRLKKLRTKLRSKLNSKLSSNSKKQEKIDLSYQRIKNEVLLRLPAKNGSLCINCHDFSKERLW